MQDVRPIGQDAVHVVVDMQDLFAGPTAWHTPSMPAITPCILRLVTHRSDRAIFTRFMTPHTADEASGAWRTYYRRWSSVTTSCMDPAVLDVMDDFRSFIPPAHVIDKTTYSAFESDAFVNLLDAMACQTLIVTGVETDVCVLATVMTGVDRGYRVIIAEDAVTSSDEESHRAMLDLVYRRFEDQIEIGTTAEIIASWRV
ncbi:MAG: cysteine hydrolase [bacterium]|nr:cysteine hydrolase [bacterium]